MSKIEWTEKTWNPVRGCSPASPGCTHCYAMALAHRHGANPTIEGYEGLTQPSKAGPVWTGKVEAAPDAVWETPLRRRTPTMWFVNSMGDLFHPEVPDAWIDRAFAVMALCPQHTFQVLTKHPERMREYFASTRRGWVATAISNVAVGAGLPFEQPEGPVEWTDGPSPELAFTGDWPLPNVWLGVSAEDQTRAEARIPVLLDTPAAVRFVSCEPLLGPIDLQSLQYPRRYGSGWRDALWGVKRDAYGTRLPGYTSRDLTTLDWVIVGGESGPKARPMHPDCARSLRDQCAAAGVPFFFKQWGEWWPGERKDHPRHDDFADEVWADAQSYEWSDETRALRIGKRAAGNVLDGRTHLDMPTGGEGASA